MKAWSWFTGEAVKPDNKKKRLEVDYHALAKDRQKVIQALTKDPDLLFKVVAVEHERNTSGLYCDSEDEYYPCNVFFIDLLIQYKSIKESDIVNMNKLDWFQLSSNMPLSISTLEKYVNKVDWNYISTSSWYNITEEFVKKFHKKINWGGYVKLEFDKDVLKRFVFIEGIIPLSHLCIKMKKEDIITHLSTVKDDRKVIASSTENMPTFMNYLGAKITESTFEDYDGEIMASPKIFANACCEGRYIPRTPRFINLLKTAYENGDWFYFIVSCKPDEAFIEEHIVHGASKDTWLKISENVLSDAFIEKYKSKLNMLSVIRYNKTDTKALKTILGEKWNSEDVSRFVKLTPEFIDEYAEKLDWFHLCEHQELPEWLMNKYKHKLNWGQISLYQMMSEDFINTNMHMLNTIKLSMNKKIKTQAH